MRRSSRTLLVAVAALALGATALAGFPSAASAATLQEVTDFGDQAVDERAGCQSGAGADRHAAARMDPHPVRFGVPAGAVEAVSVAGSGHSLPRNGMAETAITFFGLDGTTPDPSAPVRPGPSNPGPSPSGPGPGPSHPAGACRVADTVSAWNTGLTSSITITNTGAAAISGWSLAFTLPAGQSTTSGWNATYSPTSGAVTAATPATTARSRRGRRSGSASGPRTPATPDPDGIQPQRHGLHDRLPTVRPSRRAPRSGGVPAAVSTLSRARPRSGRLGRVRPARSRSAGRLRSGVPVQRMPMTAASGPPRHSTPASVKPAARSAATCQDTGGSHSAACLADG